ncbi:hypothetical protein JOQ06_007112, partial [Pogonophryne albipinna]
MTHYCNESRIGRTRQLAVQASCSPECPLCIEAAASQSMPFFSARSALNQLGMNTCLYLQSIHTSSINKVYTCGDNSIHNETIMTMLQTLDRDKTSSLFPASALAPFQTER